MEKENSDLSKGQEKVIIATISEPTSLSTFRKCLNFFWDVNKFFGILQLIFPSLRTDVLLYINEIWPYLKHALLC